MREMTAGRPVSASDARVTWATWATRDPVPNRTGRGGGGGRKENSVGDHILYKFETVLMQFHGVDGKIRMERREQTW